VIDHDLIHVTPDSRTWARMTTFESESPERVEDALRRAVDETIPASRELPGWKGSLALATESRRRGLVVTLWDSVENLIASNRSIGELREAAVRYPGVEVSVARFEVVHDERPDAES
jgi:hypothetical protein